MKLGHDWLLMTVLVVKYNTELHQGWASPGLVPVKAGDHRQAAWLAWCLAHLSWYSRAALHALGGVKILNGRHCDKAHVPRQK